MKKVQNNDTVKVHYTGTLKTGEVFDTSKDKQPLQFVVGEGKLIKHFEMAVVGLQEKETTTVEIPAKEAYGLRNDDLLFEVPNDQLPADIAPEVGMKLVSHGQQGEKNVVSVAEVKEGSVIIDANHPLAGEDLSFEITLVEIM